MTPTTPSVIDATSSGGPSRAKVREHFPALSDPTVFLENAGGAQVPRFVADAMHRYLLETYVQLGAGYRIADRCDAVVAGAHDLMGTVVNTSETGVVVLGPSTSQLCMMLALSYADILEPGDEIILAEAGHEANINPWLRLEAQGVRIRFWRVDPATGHSPLEGLGELLNERTRLVAFTHVSNLLGEIVDVAAVTRAAHAVGARVVVDGVAYAPHRAIDVAAWDVDWYAFSTYKVYGPHMAVLYGRGDAAAELRGPNHFFIADDDVPYKFELGGVNHEGCAGLLGLGHYLRVLAGGTPNGAPDRNEVERAFAVMTELELPLQRRLLDYLASSAFRVIGPTHADASRVATISFVHPTRSAADIVAAAHAHEIGIRNGHMYAHRLCTAMGLEPEAGVVRVSMVHYNTEEEIERLIEVLRTVE
ncbi:MAG: cysteine desulfurase-like protein [Phycisphaerales bacterium]|nr:cysteine desulfurase-like protein [Phycisphaerales bacterium]NNM26387.1 cysteine desulfurase-like protein [Phycisphaerales bacterium]